ncbi:MAG: hypothetical protein M1297_09255 [Nitrospirae bacterium]|jgi:hypothetical protein|nr:hypothetical protein [Nitrospirota bacterium]
MKKNVFSGRIVLLPTLPGKTGGLYPEEQEKSPDLTVSGGNFPEEEAS